MSNPLHEAGRKIRSWRDARGLSADAFGVLVAEWTERVRPFPRQSVYNWELRGKVARPAIQRALAERGVCSAMDWLEPMAAEAA